MKPLIVGMAPGHGDSSKPIEGRIGRHLAQLSGMPYEEFLERTERVNLVEHDVPRGSWPTEEARARAKVLVQLFVPKRIVLLLGRPVAQAFGLGALDYFSPTRASLLGSSSPAIVYVVPHPSGLNRWWNDPANVAQARRFLVGVWR